MNRLLRVLFLLCFLIGCSPAPQPLKTSSGWVYASLRALDNPDEGLPPSQDLVALYIREADAELQIRMDFLDLQNQADADYILSLGDARVLIPATGDIEAYRGTELVLRSGLRVMRDPVMDTLVVSLRKDVVPHMEKGFSILAVSTPPDSDVISDQLGPVRSDALPPAPVPVWIVFWNSLASATPAQALRSWDGAHSGPLGNRHGLRHLLDAAEETQTPIALLDLATPSTLSALEFVGGLSQAQRLNRSGLLDLPAAVGLVPHFGAIPSWAMERVVALSVATARRFDLFLDGGLADSDLVYWLYAYFGDGTNHNQQATPEGLSVQARQELLEHIQTGYILGGRLDQSSWGEPQAAQATMNYLSAHPWIRVVSQPERIRHPLPLPSPTTTTTPEAEALHRDLLDRLQRSPQSPITAAAWQMYFSLLTPASPRLTELRAHYLGAIGMLLSVLPWANSPTPILDCTQDLDQDGQPECILASDRVFAIVETASASVRMAFVRDANGVHQLVAPMEQFAVGLSDPSEWRQGQDPALISGAFLDDQNYTLEYSHTTEISFRHAQRSKTIRLLPAGIQVTYEGEIPSKVVSSLTLDPWERQRPGWITHFQGSPLPGGYRWGITPNLWVEVHAEGGMTFHAFSEARAFALSPEDPNFTYPAGYWLPIPCAVVEGQAQSISLEIAP